MSIYERLKPMRLLGSLLEVVRIFFRKDGKKIEWKPNQSHTYQADMTYEFPAPDTATTESDILVSEKSSQTLMNKSLNFNPLVGGNSASDIPLSSMKQDVTAASKVIMRDAQGQMTNGLITESHLDPSLNLASEEYVDQAISDLVNGAPTSLDTLKELADEISNSVVKQDWSQADGTSKSVSHSLGNDVQVQVFDKATNEMILVDLIENTGSQVNLTASQAPGVSGWRVIIRR